MFLCVECGYITIMFVLLFATLPNFCIWWDVLRVSPDKQHGSSEWKVKAVLA
jgi:hypothetical protein